MRQKESKGWGVEQREGADATGSGKHEQGQHIRPLRLLKLIKVNK